MARAAGTFGPYGPSATSDADHQGLVGPLAVPTLRLPVVDVVRARVTASIALGVLAPGERLPDIDVLAESLDVSLITVRRALESLCHDGVLDRRRGRHGGTFVGLDLDPARLERTPGHRDVLAGIRALVGQRMVLECGVAVLVAEAVPAAADGLLSPDDDLGEASARAATTAAELDFHLRLASLCTVDGCVDQVRFAIGQVAAYLPLSDSAPLARLHHEHALIVEAVCAGDVHGTLALMRSHLHRLHHQAMSPTGRTTMQPADQHLVTGEKRRASPRG